MTKPRPQGADHAGETSAEPTRSSSQHVNFGKRLRHPQLWLWILAGALIALAIVLRLAALDSDAYARLSWSSALLTDEGFYIHNARNIVLFGTARTDEFNNMLIMPTLHEVQVAWFRLFGVGAVQARLISISFSLLTLPIFFASLRRALGIKVALVGTLFLGLDHSNLLYSRMALMDTPAAALLICSVYALVRGMPICWMERHKNSNEELQSRNSQRGWIFACGVLLGVTFATRGLTALFIPGFALAVWVGARNLPSRPRIQLLAALVCGLSVSLLTFVVFWYLPHHEEISRVNRYYVADLLVPHSPGRLCLNILRGLFDYHRGTMPYLMRHSPVQFGLACVGTCWGLVKYRGMQVGNDDTSAATGGCQAYAVFMLLIAWMVISCLFLCCVSYAPSRYYVLFYPAMAALAAFTLFEAPRIVGDIVERKIVLALLGSYLLCLVGQVLRSSLVLMDVNAMHALFWGMAVALYAGSQLKKNKPQSVRHRYAEGSQPPEIWISGLTLWAVVNSYWTADWLLHLTYRQKSADHWLAASLPANSTVFGAIAPGLCLNNHFKAVSVIADLCNDGPIVEQHPPPRYIMILDGGPWRERWWDDRYPRLMTQNRRIHTFHNLLRPFFYVSVYSVDPPETDKPGLRDSQR